MVVPAVTIPELLPIFAIDGLLLFHVPPEVVLPRELVPPSHAINVPVMGPGDALTVTGVVAMQPVESV